MSPPLEAVFGSSEKFMATELKSSPLSRRLCRIWIFFLASASLEALLFCRLPACCAGALVTAICARWYWGSMRLNSALWAVIVGGDFGVGDVDSGLDLLVDELVLGEGAANVALEIVEGHVALLELVVELLLRVGRLELGDLGVDVFIGGGKVELGGALLQDLVLRSSGGGW